MNTAFKNTPGLASRFINGVLTIKPLANLAKHQARQMMIKRAKKIGVNWLEEVQTLQARDWQTDLAEVQNPTLSYPEYYLRPFHAYEKGGLCWEAALEFEVAAHTVHAGITPFPPEDDRQGSREQGAGSRPEGDWAKPSAASGDAPRGSRPEGDWAKPSAASGDRILRQSYHDILKKQILNEPQDILDLGCSVGMSTFALQQVYPYAKITGLDLSPYFLAVAHYRSQQRHAHINWIHAAAESTMLPNASFDLLSIFLMCHELPQAATRQIFAEARRLLRPSGHLAIMDLNPKSEVYKKMPPYILTLLKSTEPYLDEYFALDIEQALVEAGFNPTITPNSPRHRTIIACVEK